MNEVFLHSFRNSFIKSEQQCKIHMLFSFIRIYLRAFSVSDTGLSTKDTSQ